jgi:hypothetical protein
MTSARWQRTDEIVRLLQHSSAGVRSQWRRAMAHAAAELSTKSCIGAFRLGNLPHGQGRRVGNRSYEARKRHENRGDCGSPWIAALGQHARGGPSRSPFGAAMFRLLLIEAKPENLIGDRAYDSDPRPHRGNRSRSTPGRGTLAARLIVAQLIILGLCAYVASKS